MTVDVVTGELLPVTTRDDLLTAAPVAEVLALQTQYRELCTGLLEPEDFQRIGKTEFKKKSAWRKLAVAFNVSTEVLEERETRDDDGRLVRAHYRVKAEAPNGRHWEGIGVCDRYERCCLPGCTKSHRHCPASNYGGTCYGFTHFSNAEHDIPATAATRAANRACSDLFGLGEVTAEEISERDPTAETVRQPAPPRDTARNAGDVARVMNNESPSTAGPQAPIATGESVPVVDGTAALEVRLNALSPERRKEFREWMRAEGAVWPPVTAAALAVMVAEVGRIEEWARESSETYG